MKTILFLCGHNAGRSQMAEALYNHLHAGTDNKAISAGTNPSDEINPTVKKLLEDEGIDTSSLHPKMVTREMVESADRIYTMGCGVKCEEIPFPITITADLELDDPHGQDPETIHRLYQEAKEKITPL